MTDIVKVLNATEISEARLGADQIAASAIRTVGPNDYVHVVAFDGTNNDRERPALSGSPLSTNVGVLSLQLSDVHYDSSTVKVSYYRGPGVDAPGPDILEAAFATEFTLQKANEAYLDFALSASQRLATNPAETISVFITAFSRGDAVAAVFSQLVAERGVIDAATGHVLVAPGGVKFAGGVIFDPVDTMVSANLGYPPEMRNLLVLRAENEYRTSFRAADHDQPGVRTLLLLGNHCDVGGGNDRGLGALYLEAVARFIENSGIRTGEVSPDRQFDASAPVTIHTEGRTENVNSQWSEYGSINAGTLRATVSVGPKPSLTILDDGSTRSEFVDFSGNKVIRLTDTDLHGVTTARQTQSLPDGTIASDTLERQSADGTFHEFSVDWNGDRRYDAKGKYVFDNRGVEAEWEGWDFNANPLYKQTSHYRENMLVSVTAMAKDGRDISAVNTVLHIVDGSKLNVIGDGNTITLDANTDVDITGNANIISSSGKVDLSIIGDHSSINIGAQSVVRIDGEFNWLNASATTVSLTDNARATLVGDGNAVYAGNGVTATLVGDRNRVAGAANLTLHTAGDDLSVAAGANSNVGISGERAWLAMAGASVWLDDGASCTVVGAANRMVGGSDVLLIAVGSGLSVNLGGNANVNLSGDNQSISTGSASSIGFTGTGEWINASASNIWMGEHAQSVVAGSENAIVAGSQSTLTAIGNANQFHSGAEVSIHAIGNGLSIFAGTNSSIGVTGTGAWIEASGSLLWMDNGASCTMIGAQNIITAGADTRLTTVGSGDQVSMGASSTYTAGSAHGAASAATDSTIPANTGPWISSEPPGAYVPTAANAPYAPYAPYEAFDPFSPLHPFTPYSAYDPFDTDPVGYTPMVIIPVLQPPIPFIPYVPFYDFDFD